MIVKTSELRETQLDYAVAKAKGRDAVIWEGKLRLFRTVGYDLNEYAPSTNPALWATILEEERIIVSPRVIKDGGWSAKLHNKVNDFYSIGPTPGIAVCRCFCCSILGEEIDVPEELI